MPRLSKRKRQLAGLRGDEDDEEEDDVSGPSSQKSSSFPNKAAKKKSNESEEIEAVWVQCDKCGKWRGLAPTTDAKALPDIWTCNLMPPLSCSDPEETFEKETGKEKDTDEKLRYFFRVWLKKLRCSDRAEAKLAPSTLTRGRRRQMDSEWIRCCNPQCGKWRSTLRGMDAGEVLKKLKKKKWGVKTTWYCSMNSWDETLASCAAPQEPLWSIGAASEEQQQSPPATSSATLPTAVAAPRFKR